MNTKMISILTAFLMIAVAGVIIFDSDESDATCESGSVKFFYTEDLQNYSEYSACGFNVSEALSNQSALLTKMKSSVDNNYSKVYTDNGTYTSINTEWGKITRNASDVESGKVWNVFTYVKTGNGSTFEWKAADMTLGFYKPYSDYDKEHATANVILYYGAPSQVPTTLPAASDIQPLTTVTETQTFKVSFEIYYLDSTGNEQYSVIDGYGSDAALALIDAVGSNNVSLRMNPGVSYGYLDSMYGLSTTDANGYWEWWHMENNTLTDNAYTESQFYLGFYIPMSGFALSCNMISLTYY